MALITKCSICPRSSSIGDGWWQVHDYKTEPPTVSDLCPSCYRNKSLLAYRDTLLEVIEKINIPYDNGSEWTGMEVMKLRCIAAIRDTAFND
jgi:hypothetical protein